MLRSQHATSPPARPGPGPSLRLRVESPPAPPGAALLRAFVAAFRLQDIGALLRRAPAFPPGDGAQLQPVGARVPALQGELLLRLADAVLLLLSGERVLRLSGLLPLRRAGGFQPLRCDGVALPQIGRAHV